MDTTIETPNLAENISDEVGPVGTNSGKAPDSAYWFRRAEHQYIQLLAGRARHAQRRNRQSACIPAAHHINRYRRILETFPCSTHIYLVVIAPISIVTGVPKLTACWQVLIEVYGLEDSEVN